MVTVNGTPESDRLFSRMDDDTEILGLAGNDVLFAASGSDTLDGGDGFDVARFTTTFNGDPIFLNGVTANLLTGQGTALALGETYTYSLRNIEDLWGSSAADTLVGDDTSNEIQGLSGNDALFGLGGNDRLFSGSGDDTVNGGDGNDSLYASDGNTSFNGDAGRDWMFFDTTLAGNPVLSDGVTVNLSIGQAVGQAGSVIYDYTIAGIENLGGSATEDVLIGDDADNELWGYLGDDTIKGGAGDDFIQGGDGNDVSLYDGASNHFTVQFRVDDLDAFIIDRTEQEGTDQGGTNILRFSDRDFTLVADGDIYFDEAEFTEAEFLSLVELYIAYFNRAPDAEGLNFWTLAVINGTSLDEAANFFFNQPETRALYGTELDTPVFITSVYVNVLGRGPDDAGRVFWEQEITSGRITEGGFIRDFLLGARAEPGPDATPAFIAQQTADRAYLDTKTDIGVNFGAILGMSNVDNANAVMSLFDGTEASLTAARTATDAAYQAALATDGSGEMLIQVVGFVDDPFAV